MQKSRPCSGGRAFGLELKSHADPLCGVICFAILVFPLEVSFLKRHGFSCVFAKSINANAKARLASGKGSRALAITGRQNIQSALAELVAIFAAWHIDRGTKGMKRSSSIADFTLLGVN